MIIYMDNNEKEKKEKTGWVRRAHQLGAGSRICRRDRLRAHHFRHRKQ